MGYCPVCEGYVALASGQPCPKHDVDLQTAPEPTEAWPEGGGLAGLVTLVRSSDPGRVEALRIRLEAEGIPTFLQGSRMGSASMYLVATGGPILQVPAALADEARVILAQAWAEPFDDDDAWEEWEPEPWTTRREILNSVLVLFLLLSILAALLILMIDRV